MQKNSSSIYGTRGNIIPSQDWGVVTAKDKTYYIHILKSTGLPYIFIPGLKGSILAAQQLTTGKKVRFQQQPEGVFVYLEAITMDSIDTIIQLNY
jgi:alpha-L-fucosidase